MVKRNGGRSAGRRPWWRPCASSALATTAVGQETTGRLVGAGRDEGRPERAARRAVEAIHVPTGTRYAATRRRTAASTS